MKVKARFPFYSTELGLVKRGQVFETDNPDFDFVEAVEALPPFPPRRGGKNGNTVKRNPRSGKTGEKN